MKNILTALSAVLLFCACSAISDKRVPRMADNSFVHVKYKQPLNGYLVSVLWQPDTAVYQGYVSGPAILTFRDASDSAGGWTVTMNSFKVHYSRVPFKFDADSSTIISTVDTVQLQYDLDSLGKTGWSSVEPISFVDVDFDNEEDLLLCDPNGGQRFDASYKAYKLKDGVLVDDLDQITYQEPYNEIDGFTRIDYEKKTLTLYWSGGACDGATLVYKFKKPPLYDDGEKHLVLDKFIQRKDCATYTYDVSTQLKLRSVQKMDNSEPLKKPSSKNIDYMKMLDPANY